MYQIGHKEESFYVNIPSKNYELLTCSREVKAASRYFFPFLLQADETTFRMESEDERSFAEIALWQDPDRAPNAINRTSFPCHISIQSGN